MKTETESKTNHTPLPWESGMHLPRYSADGVWEVYRVDGSRICTMNEETIAEETAKANAEFIAMACNSHAELVEALKGVIDYAENEASSLHEVVRKFGPDDVAEEAEKASAAIDRALAIIKKVEETA